MISVELFIGIVAVILVLWVRWQQRVHAALEKSMSAANATRGAARA
jgi:hypothetical protein